MWAYVDETGNTGDRIFDPDQPYFITAGMATKANFDLVWGQEIAEIAKGASVAALHANELGVGRLEDIAPEILRIVKKADALLSQSLRETLPCRC